MFIYLFLFFFIINLLLLYYYISLAHALNYSYDKFGCMVYLCCGEVLRRGKVLTRKNNLHARERGGHKENSTLMDG